MRKLLNILVIVSAMLLAVSCARVPKKYLHEEGHMPIAMPAIELSLDIYWDYTLDNGWSYSYEYDWRKEWSYGWDEEDRRLFGDSIGYSTKPNTFNIRRYFTGQDSAALHTTVDQHQVYDTLFLATYKPGWYDLLVWNEVTTIDGVQAIRFDETSSLDSVTAYTGMSRMGSFISGVNDSHTAQAVHYQPEALFSDYYENLLVTLDTSDYVWDPIRGIYYRHLEMLMLPRTYIYLVQLILHHNYGKVDNTTGNAILSGMAYNTNLNTGYAGTQPINVFFNNRMKRHLSHKGDPDVDIIGGRLYTFGICGVNPYNVRKRVVGSTTVEATQTAADIYAADGNRHYVDFDVVFSNGNDSVITFDVTDKVRQFYRGGVLTLELDMDTVPVPGKKHSLFDVVVAEPDSVTYEFPM